MKRTPTSRTARLLAAATAAILLTGLTTLITASPAEATTRWSGFSINGGRTADSRWIGAYTAGGNRLYQFQPAARHNTRGYRDIVIRKDLGSRATAWETQRAAWILSKYGSYKNAVQQAAVDAATYSLAYGGGMTYNRSRGYQRIRQTGRNASTILAWTKQMLQESSKHAGRPKLTVSAPSTTVGAYVTAVATVVDGRGNPMPRVTVRVAFDGQRITGTTNSAGQVKVQFPATEGGTRTITARAYRLPAPHVYVARSRVSNQASAVIGGRRITLVRTRSVAIAGNQRLSISSTDTVITTKTKSAVKYTVTGQGGEQTVTTQLYGPFTTAAAATCAGRVRATATQTITDNGTYTTPAMAAQPWAGYYKRKVTVSGNALNQPVSSCAALFTNRAVTTASLARLGELRRGLGSTITARLRVLGLPNTAPVSAGVRVYGPFSTSSSAVCDAAKRSYAYPLTFRGDGTKDVTFKPARKGWYIIQGDINASELNTADVSPCGGENAFVQVR